MTCDFCAIARGETKAAIAWETAKLVVFADHYPIRPGHVQIIPKAHFAVFDDLPEPLAAQILWLGQRIARAQKQLYNVQRVGFVFTGNEVPHAHAHIVPLHAADDITSARYRDGAIRIDHDAQHQTAATLAQALYDPAYLGRSAGDPSQRV